jgi:hypothetical protein
MPRDRIAIPDHAQFKQLIGDLDAEHATITTLVEAVAAPAAAAAKAAAGAATGSADCDGALDAYRELLAEVGTAYTEAESSARAGAVRLSGVTEALAGLQRNLIGIDGAGAAVVREA